MVRERNRIVAPVTAADIPARSRRSRARRSKNACKFRSPGVLAIERNGIGQKALEQLWRLLRRVERVQPVLLGNAEIFAEAFDLIHGLAAFAARRLEQQEAGAGECPRRK